MAYPIFRGKHHKSGRSSEMRYVLVAEYHGRLPETIRADYVRIPLTPKPELRPSAKSVCSAETTLNTLDLMVVNALNERGRPIQILAVPDDYEIPDHHLLTKVEADA